MYHTNTSGFHKWSFTASWPYDQIVYVCKTEDVWNDKHKTEIGGSKKRDSTQAELESFERTAADAMPWKRMPPDEHIGSSSHALTPPRSQSPNNTDHKQEHSSGETHQDKRSAVQGQPVKPEPQPSPSKDCKEQKDPEYESTMNSLISSIHKVSGEWHRKSREYSIAVIRSKQNQTTQGSKVEHGLEVCIQRGNNLRDLIADVETMYATKTPVTHERQLDVKSTIAKIYEMVKAANKLKFLEGVPSDRRNYMVSTHEDRACEHHRHD